MIFNEKSTCRWEFKIDSIDGVEYESVTRPKFIMFNNEKRIDLLEMTAIIKDTNASRAAEKIMQFLNTQVSDYSLYTNAYLTMFNHDGTAIEQWCYTGMRISEIDFKTLDTINSCIPRIHLKLSYQHVSYK